MVGELRYPSIMELVPLLSYEKEKFSNASHATFRKYNYNTIATIWPNKGVILKILAFITTICLLNFFSQTVITVNDGQLKLKY